MDTETAPAPSPEPEIAAPPPPPPPPAISRPRPARPQRFRVVEPDDVIDEEPPSRPTPKRKDPPPEEGTREIPKDPGELEAARSTVAAEVELCLIVFNKIAEAMPPKIALTDDDKKMIRDPLADVLYKYDLLASPEFRLVGALAIVFGSRYAMAKMAAKEGSNA